MEIGQHLLDVTVVLPCLNEERGVGATVEDALEGLRLAGVTGEVLVVDNGSSDDSVVVARRAGARVVCEPRRRYGAAHLRGIQEARGEVIVMADADETYDLLAVGHLLDELSRLRGNIESGAMPVLHRKVGTPVLNGLLTRMSGIRVSDSQSGYRAFYREKALTLGLRAPGMEFASELLLRASRTGWNVVEVPSDYRVRTGESKLDTFSDGWRHLRMLLVLSPHTPLMIPGIAPLLVGLALCAIPLLSAEGISAGPYRWLPVFAGPTFLVLGGLSTFVGAPASSTNELTPERLRWRLNALLGEDALDRLVRFCAALVALAVILELGLGALYLPDRSRDPGLGHRPRGSLAMKRGLPAGASELWEAEPIFEWRVRPWRFSLLALSIGAVGAISPDIPEVAATDRTGADAAVQASTGEQQMCAVTSPGGVKCWAGNSFGQLLATTIGVDFARDSLGL